MKRLTRTEWNKTPYAGSTAKDTDRDIERLLEKYGVKETMFASYTGDSGRPGFGVRFVLKGKTYRIALTTLDAQADETELKVQTKRAIYFFLKASLEVSNVFMPPEQVLFAFLELPGAGNATMYEGAKGYLQQLASPDFGRLMLPPKRDD